MFVTAQQIQDALNPSAQPTKYTTDKQWPGFVSSVISDADALITSHLPEVYRRMQRHIRGLKLTDSASDGQTAFAVPAALSSVSSALAWVNYCGLWGDRNISDAVACDWGGVLERGVSLTIKREMALMFPGILCGSREISLPVRGLFGKQF